MSCDVGKVTEGLENDFIHPWQLTNHSAQNFDGELEGKS